MKANFVTFFSPGTFVAEQSIQEIDSWDIAEAQRRAEDIKERYDATPYAFQFTTRSRSFDDLDSKISETSPRYFINCKVETREEVEDRNDPEERILRSNMRCNGYDRIATTIEGWKWTQPMDDDDVLLV